MKISKEDLELFKDVEIYGFAGKLGVGKNYVSEKIFSKMLQTKQYVIMSFADALKIKGITEHGLERYKCFVEKDDHARKAMQRIGTEEGRNVVGKDIWLKHILEWMIIHVTRGNKRIIISDVRFHNEFDFVKDLGGYMIKVDAPERNRKAAEKEAQKNNVSLESIINHSSETELEGRNDFDYTLNNEENTEKSIYVQVRDMIRDIEEKRKDELVIFCDLDNTICECNKYYTQKAEEARELIRGHLSLEIPSAVFNSMFNDFVDRHNANFIHDYFELERFPSSLSLVAEDFRPFLKEEGFDGLHQSVYKIGESVFDASYKDLGLRVRDLEELNKMGRVVLFTMGDRYEQVKKISELGLSDYDFEVYNFKDETIFRNLMEKYPANTYCMIGDSLERDVKPAVQAGLDYAFYIKPDIEGYWREVEEGKHTSPDNYYVVSNLSNVKKILSSKEVKIAFTQREVS